MGTNQVKKVIIPALYATVMISAYLGMPPNPDEITAPMDLVTCFRIASAFMTAMF